MRREGSIEIIACDVMWFLGSATRCLCESFYYIAPFMRPEKTKGAGSLPEDVPGRQDIKSSAVKESVVMGLQEDLSSREAVKKASQKPKIAGLTKEEATSANISLEAIEFENKLEQLRAEMIVKSFRSSPGKPQGKILEQLEKISKPAAVGILKKLLDAEKKPLRIIEILDVFSGLNEDSTVAKGIFKDFLKHPHPRLRQVAIRALAKYRDEESFSIISSCLADENAEIRRQTLNYLCWFFSDKCASAVLKSLHDVDDQVRKSAIIICGTLKLRQSTPALITLLDDSDTDMQKEAVLSLRKISGVHFGFKLAAQKRGNKAAINKWRLWWQESQVKF